MLPTLTIDPPNISQAAHSQAFPRARPQSSSTENQASNPHQTNRKSRVLLYSYNFSIAVLTRVNPCLKDLGAFAPSWRKRLRQTTRCVQNKPNFKIGKTTLTHCHKRSYADFSTHRPRKNNPNSNPISPPVSVVCLPSAFSILHSQFHSPPPRETVGDDQWSRGCRRRHRRGSSDGRR